MDLRNLELVALRDVYLSKLRKYDQVSPDFDVRKIFREYSKIFHTPLHVVQTLPIEDVALAWLEEVFESYTVEDLRQEATEMLRDPGALEFLRRREDEQDAEMHRHLEEEKKVEKALKKIEDVVQKLTPQAILKRSKEPELDNVKPLPKPIQEGIKMVFEDVDLDADSFGLLDNLKPEK